MDRRHISHSAVPTAPVPTEVEIISELLRTENIHTTRIIGGLNTWITAPQEEFPDLYPIYVAYTERLANEETKGDTQYTQFS